MIHDSLQYLHAINLAPQLGSQSIRKLLRYFETPEAVWGASKQALSASGLGEKVIDSLIAYRSRTTVSQVWEVIEQSHIQCLSEEDDKYPKELKEIHNPPFLIYTRGRYAFNTQPLIAIVGSRHNTPYGERVTQHLAQELSAAGIGIVSGLAFGIDGIAHRGALDAQGNTIAVLGNGLDDASLYPKAHLSLARTILDRGGALVSEYPPRTPASSFTFPARNRIIAGITLGTIVVEAAEKSGSLITAKWALEYNREVFAVPGSVFSEASSGPHTLIRSGAKIVTHVKDILEEIRPLSAPNNTSRLADVALSPEEMTLLSLLSTEPLHIDRILKATTLETAQVQSSMVMLEVKGVAKNIGGMHYIRTLS